MVKLQKGIFDGYFENLFRPIYVANSSKSEQVVMVTEDIRPYAELLHKYVPCVSYEYYPSSGSDRMFNFPAQNNDVLLAFSGGKDSLATAIRLKTHGLNPVGYFVRGINRSYTQEIDHAEALARILNMELIVKDVKITGKCDYKENPTKNQFILAMMVDEGIKRGIYKFAFGNIGDDHIETCSVDYMFSDAYELFEASAKFYRERLSRFKLLKPLETEADSVLAIAGYDSNLFKSVSSCVGPLRYKASHRRHKENKYGIMLMPERCGTCYKCAYEALALNALGALDYPESYLEYCSDKLSEWLKILAPGDESVWFDSLVFSEYAKKHKVNKIELG